MVEKLYDLLLFVILHFPGFTPFTAVVPTTASFKADHVTASLKILPLSLSPPLVSFALLTNHTTFI